ncbi:hypothetical protein WH47_07547 [Habropoda laboriosa]|uniref:Uncharacterized protein n=1 Tax=Habropoda laboriosa TaxID=597456 RepID=A0A0L7QQ75_9HYME|nr:hypothetical protein WH47_07547 [Habropoda laboriosa]
MWNTRTTTTTTTTTRTKEEVEVKEGKEENDDDEEEGGGGGEEEEEGQWSCPQIGTEGNLWRGRDPVPRSEGWKSTLERGVAVRSTELDSSEKATMREITSVKAEKRMFALTLASNWEDQERTVFRVVMSCWDAW